MRRRDREITDIRQKLDIISKSKICHIALNDSPAPYIVAFNFGFEYHNSLVIYFHSAKKGKKIDLINKNNSVSFHINAGHELITGEKACDYSMTYSSVFGYGKISIIDDVETKKHGLDLIMKQYTGEQEWDYYNKMLENTAILKLDVANMYGKMLSS